MGKYFDCRFGDFTIHHSLMEHPNNSMFPMHAHDSLEIYYFLSGYCRYLVEGKEYVLKPHDVMIMRPSETHNLKVMGDMPYERIVIQLFPNKFKDKDKYALLMKPFFDRPLGQWNRYSESDFDTKLYQLCFESISDDSPVGIELEVEAKMFTIMCEIYKAYCNRKDHGEEPGTQKGETVVQLIDYINDNLYEPLSLSHLSEKFFLSQSQLNRLFKKATGTSVWEYITIKRLIAARNRIRVGEQSGRVCTQCGFKDYSSFYRMYKSRFGVSPKQDDMTKRSKNKTQ